MKEKIYNFFTNKFFIVALLFIAILFSFATHCFAFTYHNFDYTDIASQYSYYLVRDRNNGQYVDFFGLNNMPSTDFLDGEEYLIISDFDEYINGSFNRHFDYNTALVPLSRYS